jgi:hypothetical protein
MLACSIHAQLEMMRRRLYSSKEAKVVEAIRSLVGPAAGARRRVGLFLVLWYQDAAGSALGASQDGAIGRREGGSSSTQYVRDYKDSYRKVRDKLDIIPGCSRPVDPSEQPPSTPKQHLSHLIIEL